MKYLCVLLVLASIAHAAPPQGEVPQRLQRLFNTITCVACAGQPIGQSNAPAAADTRHFVVQQIMAGASDAEIYASLRARYGDDIVLAPALHPSTWLLWAFPPLALGVGGYLLWRRFKQPR